MDRRDMPSSRELLPGLLARLAASTGDARPLEPIWRAVVGPSIARAAHPVRLEGGCLQVRVSGPRWVEELRGRADVLRARLLERGVVVSEISFSDEGA